MGDLASAMERGQQSLVADTLARVRNRPVDTSVLDGGLVDGINRGVNEAGEESEAGDEYNFNVYAHKGNTHITVSKPNRQAIVSMSTGNLGYRKSNRGTYDAAFQLAAYVMDRLLQKAWHKKIQNMAVVLRGFGPGREAVVKVLLGSEGRPFRNSIRRVADSTRLKFGGTRSKKPRRLG